MKSLTDEIREDAVYKEFMGIFRTAQKKVNPEESLKEIFGLHSSRTGRSLMGADRFNPHKIADANATDMSHRARMAEIRAKSSIQLGYLERGINEMRRHIITSYADDLKDDFKTRDLREAYVKRVLKKPIRFLEEGQTMIETIDYLIKDIDQANFSFTRITDCMKLLAETRGRVK